MRHTLKYGDVIRSQMGPIALFIHYWPNTSVDRPSQKVLILDGAGSSLRDGELLTVNWLDLDGNEPEDFRVTP